MKPYSLLAALLALPAAAHAELKVAPIFGDHMVLQRESGAPVFGTADPKEAVHVHFRDKEHTAIADDSGKWSVTLPDLKAGGPDDLTVAVGEDETITLTDVLVGEVWVGSGQSNMAGNVRGYAKNDPKLATLLTSEFPEIRLLRGGPTPTWTVADPESIPAFSAILFAFGDRLHSELDVPVGLMVGAVGGTPSGQWLSQKAFDNSEKCAAALEKARSTYDAAGADENYRAQLAKWEKAAAEAEAKGEKPKGRKPNPPVAPGELPRGGKIGGLYERYISSMVGFGIRGVLWDQGESGTGVLGIDQTSMMHALITGWRNEWGQGEFPFLFVQKPSGGGCAFDPENPITKNAEPYKAPPAEVPKSDPNGRLLYVRLMEIVPGAFMVPASDLGSGIHPTNKWGYGNRAARIALGKVYKGDTVPFGPTYESHGAEGEKLRVRFTGVGGGLTFAHPENLTGFALAGEDGIFHWAAAEIDGESVLLRSPDVPAPVHASFGASKSRPWANLFNREGQPALAFETETGQ